MSMVTQCPGCNTTFRVTPQQLQAQHGKVRCGRCATVFDGFSALAALPDESPGTAPPQPVADAGRQVAADAAKRARVEPSLAPKPAWDLAVPEAPPPVFAVPPLAAALPHAARSSWWANVGWACGILLLLITLAAQGAYFYRSGITAAWPEARPYLDWLCKQLNCTVALPQEPRLISIEGSDMVATDPANPGLIALTATLRNQATIELGYPALDVVLTNVKNHTVARRIYLPMEYLGPGHDARAGIPPNAEITVRLDIDSGGLGAAGFRLDLLPAPIR